MDINTVVVGAGVVGLAIGRALAKTGREVLLLERNGRIGEETSSRNSEVIHAGIYYPKDSLKAQMCVRGKQMLYEFCDAFKVEHQRLGKLIVAVSDEQLDALSAIYQKGLANGVNDLRIMEASELAELEPELSAIKAIHSPSTGIINSHELMVALQGDLESHSGVVSFLSEVTKIEVLDGGFRLFIGQDQQTQITCKELINCGGLGAQALSHSMMALPRSSVPPRHLSKGCYFALSGRTPFSHLIYPLPNNEGLGVHLTLDLQGQARFGPDTEWVEAINYDVDPDRGNSFYSSIRQYYPGLRDGQLQPAYSGIRPKITGPGELAGDFNIQCARTHGITGYLALYGIESPGLTSALAIAEQVAAQLH